MNREQVFGKESRVRLNEVNATSGSKFIGATFLYLALGLFVTFGVVALVGSLLNFAIFRGSVDSLETFAYIFFFALVIYIPVMIWVHVAACRNGRTVGPAFFTYSIVMGVLLSPIALIDFWTLFIAFGTTCLAFAVMALIAWLSKKDMSSLAVIGSGLIIGALIISLFNFIITLITGTFNTLYWVVSFLLFVGIIILTIVDLNRVKQIANSGVATKNLALLCALNLYVDFIYIFIRVLRIVVIIAANRK